MPSGACSNAASSSSSGRRVRREILDQLLKETNFDLPADLVARQETSTLRRQLHEMREAGMSDSEIRAREAEPSGPTPTSRPAEPQGVLPPVQDRRGRGTSRSRKRTSRRKSRRSPPAPTRPPAGSAPGSRRRASPRGSPPRSSNARRSTASWNSSAIEESPLQEERAVETLDQSAALTASPSPKAKAEGGEAGEPDSGGLGRVSMATWPCLGTRHVPWLIGKRRARPRSDMPTAPRKHGTDGTLRNDRRPARATLFKGGQVGPRRDAMPIAGQSRRSAEVPRPRKGLPAMHSTHRRVALHSTNRSTRRPSSATRTTPGSGR